VQWAASGVPEGNVWNCLIVFVKASIVPLLDITFDYAKTNAFNVWWYLPCNRGSHEIDVTFEDDMKAIRKVMKWVA
jgi:hypothetical protein